MALAGTRERWRLATLISRANHYAAQGAAAHHQDGDAGLAKLHDPWVRWMNGRGSFFRPPKCSSDFGVLLVSLSNPNKSGSLQKETDQHIHLFGMLPTLLRETLIETVDQMLPTRREVGIPGTSWHRSAKCP